LNRPYLRVARRAIAPLGRSPGCLISRRQPFKERLAMKQHSHFVFTSPVLAAVLIWVGVWQQGYVINFPMISNFPSNPYFIELRNDLEDVPGASAYRYNITDSSGRSMDTAKIIADPSGGYLAIYHTFTDGCFEVSLATSSDMMHWQYRQSYGSHTHQPYLAAAPDGGFVLANEADKGNYNWVQVRYFPSRETLLENQPSHTFNAPHTLVPADHSAEGTPNIYSIHLDPDIDHSAIEIGFHYFKDGIADRQASGRLVNFSNWTTQAQPQMDQNLIDFGVLGNIGDRDEVTFRDSSFLICEGQLIAGDFGSWRVFLTDQVSGRTVQLNVRTHAGSQAFANPTISVLPSPNGGQAVVVTYFVPADRAAPGEAGELIFYRDLASFQDEG
jgi:hypothetical protein